MSREKAHTRVAFALQYGDCVTVRVKKVQPTLLRCVLIRVIGQCHK